ncbi:UNVERIFIED_CONTAM: hypothetical protein O8I53_05940 [Campylobacter lari]
MKKSKSKVIYTNNNIKALEKEYNRQLRTSLFNKNIVPVQKDRFTFIEKIIKFFIKIILFIALPKTTSKNKVKTKELIDRVYIRFMSRDFAFIPVSLAFYLLASFIPIMFSVYLLLGIIPGGFGDLFSSLILSSIIPGIGKFLESWPNAGVGEYITIITLYLASL